MKSLEIKKIENIIERKLKTNCTSIGFDTAKERTGIAIIETLKSTLKIKQLYCIDNQKSDLKKYTAIEAVEYYLGELNRFIKMVKFKGRVILAIEQPYFGKNVGTLIVLQSYAILTWYVNKHIADHAFFIRPITCRSQIGFFRNRNKGDKRKQKRQVQDYINNLFGLKLKNNNLTDAIALGLCGLIK